jgi:hypothetical protein
MDPIRVEVVEPPRGPSRRPGRARAALLACAALAVALLWLRGQPGFVAWEVARDHQRCFGRRQLAARLWSDDPWEIREFLESRGTPVQPLPKAAGNVEIVGVRYCPLVDRIAAHVYYGGEGSLVSVFVLSRPARVGAGWSGVSRGLQVRLFPSAGRIVAVVGQSAADVDAVARAFHSSVARFDRPGGAC